jgi:Head domain of trimeric autotransporter adhesin
MKKYLLLVFIITTKICIAQNVGIGTLTPQARLHVKDSSVLFTGATVLPTVAHNTPVSGAGTRMMWYPDKAAFRTGYAYSNEWDSSNIGLFSFAAGNATKAYGNSTAAFGYFTQALGNYSLTAGISSTATGTASIALGSGANAGGNYSAAFGSSTFATGPYSIAAGYVTTASGFGSTAFGYDNIASGSMSSALGYSTIASGDRSTALGSYTKAKGNNTLAIGSYNDTSNINSLFEIGNGTADNARSNALTVLSNGNIGIGTANPDFPLSFANTPGDKISLTGNAATSIGFGVQPSLMQLHTNANNADIAFGYGSSTAFTERARIINNGMDGMVLKGRLLLQNGSTPLNVAQTPGVWLYKADNSNLLGFMGTQNNQNVGFFGGPTNGGWGFVYDAINSRVGIGKDNPTSSLNVNGQVTIDQKNFGGYGGLLLKGDAPGNNYPNIGFSIKNTSNADVVGAMLQGELANSAVGSEAINLGFYTAQTGFGSLSQKMVIMGNGKVGIGESNPGFPLNFPSTLGDKISLYGNAGNHYGFGVQGGTLQIHAGVATDDIAFGYGSSTLFTERVRFKGNGDVFIGTNNLTSGVGYKLRVGGKIMSEEVRVELQSSWPDYVFDKKYKKLSIAELEKYINTNNHLPNIPSAAEVEKDGQNLGEIQRKMLEKMEELTLYVIELKKEIEKLKLKK